VLEAEAEVSEVVAEAVAVVGAVAAVDEGAGRSICCSAARCTAATDPDPNASSCSTRGL
jgi:hypothetical protein